MRRALLIGALLLAGCGSDSQTERLRDDVKDKTEKVRERVERAGKQARESDKALLQIERSDLPDDVKKELLEAQELLDEHAEP